MSQLNLGKVVGRGVQSFSKTKTEGLTDTYTMAYTDGTSSAIEITHNSKNNYTDSAVAEVAKIANKVDKVDGKGLSTNDLTNELKASYDGAVTKANNADNKVNDINVLGWVVPDACPIKNYVGDDGKFHQLVDRVDLGSLEWLYWTGKNQFYAELSHAHTLKGGFCNAYTVIASGTYLSEDDPDKTLIIRSNSDYMYCKDLAYGNDATAFKQAVKGTYLYYELATEITKKVDGNEVVVDVDKSLAVIGKCKNLLNPTLQTTTVNGVTCTNNGDGTCTVNGTASDDTTFRLCYYQKTVNRPLRIVGCPAGGSSTTYLLSFRYETSGYNDVTDIGNGSNAIKDNGKGYDIIIKVSNGTTVSNLLFKPMLTTNLNATYDDFVPYTGSGDTLMADVASVKSVESYTAIDSLILSKNGIVCEISLDGCLVSGINDITLPTKYIPNKKINFPVLVQSTTNSYLGIIQIDTSGKVKVWGSTTYGTKFSTMPDDFKISGNSTYII